MGDTIIEWTDSTWNPVTGCTKVSQGCKHCYAERVFPRAYSKHVWHEIEHGIENFRDRKFTDVACHPERLEQPLHWKKPRRIFVNSMSDLFHEAVPDEFLLKVFNTMRRGWQHNYQILTKRPERMRAFCKNLRFSAHRDGALTLDGGPGYRLMGGGGCTGMTWVWLGVSVEDQPTADERIPILLQTPAAVRFVSLEPLLAPIDLSKWLGGSNVTEEYRGSRLLVSGERQTGDRRRGADMALDWIICGGESGPGARPCNVQWIRDIIAQCKAAGVACFVKQLGRNPVEGFLQAHMGSLFLEDKKGGDWDEWPADLRIREYPI